MTRPFLVDFDERKRQVRHYLAIVSKAERQIGLRATRVEEGRLLTLRAGTFLVLYNLVEAGTRGAIQAVHDEITTKEAQFSLLTLSLRKEVIRLFKRGADPAKDHTFDDFPAGVVSIALQQSINLSGTVDARAIRDLAECYGFSHHTAKKETRDGSDLVVVKRNRNDLAHGRKTFEQVGRDYPRGELLLIARRSMAYMDGVLKNIGTYLDSEGYLE